MPRLIFFGVCQKAIIDRQDGNVSLITLLNSITVQVLGDTQIPHDAMLTAQWSTAATWHREPDDDGKTFQSRIELVFPSGEMATPPIFGEPFESVAITNTTVTSANLLPIGEAGEYTVRISLREVGTNDWQDAGNIPLDIEYQRQVPQGAAIGTPEQPIA
jgi:hypothetical protein